MSNSGQISQPNPNMKTYRSNHLTNIGKKLYQNTEWADVHFSFVTDDGTTKRVPAHKIMLAAGSDVFEAMFYGDLREKGDVHVTDVSEAAFVEFLQFFYLDWVKVTAENIAGVMYLGDKYNVPTCVSICVRFLKDVLSADKVLIGLNLAILYDHQELKELCESFIMLNTAEVLQTNGFLECGRQELAHILRMDVLACSEADVFKASMAWVCAKSKQNVFTKEMVQKHLGDLYYEIRFKSMSMQELCALQAEHGSVLQTDFVTIANMIALPAFQAGKFNKDARHAKWNAKAIVVCDLSPKDGKQSPYELSSNEVTTFSSNKPFLLGGFVCGKVQVEGRECKRDLTSDLPVDVEISEISLSNGTNAKVVLTMRSKLQSIDANHIQLPHPILIRPNLPYKISIGQFPAQHVHYSRELKKTVPLQYNSAKVEFYNCSIGLDGKVVGLISCLNFNLL